jgi:hypothetical protein
MKNSCGKIQITVLMHTGGICCGNRYQEGLVGNKKPRADEQGLSLIPQNKILKNPG